MEPCKLHIAEIVAPDGDRHFRCCRCGERINKDSPCEEFIAVCPDCHAAYIYVPSQAFRAASCCMEAFKSGREQEYESKRQPWGLGAQPVNVLGVE